MKRPSAIAVILATLALSVSTLAPARDDDRRGRRDRGREREEHVERPKVKVSLDQAVAMAEKRYNARVVKAEPREQGDRIVYVLRLLNEAGRVWTVKVDASSGSMH